MVRARREQPSPYRGNETQPGRLQRDPRPLNLSYTTVFYMYRGLTTPLCRRTCHMNQKVSLSVCSRPGTLRY